MVLIVPYFLAVIAAAGPGHAPRLAVENCDAGEVYAFNKAECNIALSNNSDAPIRVFDAKTVNESDRVEPRELVVAPRAHAYLKVSIDSANGVAFMHHKVHFRTDEHGNEDRLANAGVFVMTVLDEVRPQLDFGTARAGSVEPVRKSIELVSHDVTGLRITKVIEAPAWLDASIAADGRTLTAAVKPDAGWGIHADFVKVAINAPQQSQAWIEAKADVHGEIVPNLNPYDMGLMRIGSAHEFHIALHSRSGREFQVGKVELEGLQGTTQFDTCEKPGGNCRMLILRVADQQPGPIKGHVWIEFPEYHQRLNLAMWGLLVPADLKVKTLDEAMAAQGADAASGKSQASKAIDLQHAVKEAVSTANLEPPPGKGPLLKWTIANGQAIHGFQIFRSGDEAGPFVLLNPKTIASLAMTQDSISYQYRDNSAESGKTYWYYIGIVYSDGHKQQLSGQQKVIAK
jgi:hypothetical protein